MKSKGTDANSKQAMKMTSASHRELEMLDNRTRLYLLRHGEVTTSHEWRFVGHMDVELTETGIHQMERAGARLKSENIDALLSSDLRRTKKGAKIIGSMLNLKPYPHADFREINIGRWEGLTRDEILTKYGEEFEGRSTNLSGYRISGGESFLDLKERVLKRLTFVLEQYQGKNIALVAHGGVNRVILCHVLGIDLNNLLRVDQDYGCLNIIDYFDAMPVVRLMNST
jgi:alpha-ribazole phosphatase/probable phosphoglycerate mutase